MKVFIIAHEIPYPPGDGNRVNTWNWIRAFKQKGVHISLLAWHAEQKDILQEHELNIVREVVDELMIFNLTWGINRIINLFRYPSLATARLLDKKKYTWVLHKLKEYQPDFIYLDSIYCGVLGLNIAKDLKIPVCARLNNIEHFYIKGQYKLAKNFKLKLALLASVIHLKRYEKHIISSVDYFIDVSLNDIKHWQAKGYHHGNWIPPIVINDHEMQLYSSEIKYDIGFFGNLYSPNNVEGLRWFVDEVLPIIRKRLSNVRMIFMGRNPSEDLLAFCKEIEGLTIIANPHEPNLLLSQTSVLINPVFFGSGVNVKSINMLFGDNQVVSTSVGVQGLPKQLHDVFYIADSPAAFAEAILNILLNGEYKDIEQRRLLRSYFDENAVDSFTDKMYSLKKMKQLNAS